MLYFIHLFIEVLEWKKILLISTLFVFLVACNNGDDNNPENEIALNEQHEVVNDEFVDDISAEHDEINTDIEFIEFDLQSVELIDVNQYTGILKEHAQSINDYVTYQNNGDDDSFSKIVGPVQENTDPRYKIINVEIDEELSYEREGKYFVEVNLIRMWEKDVVLSSYMEEQIVERSTSFVFQKIDGEWIIVYF